MVLGQPQGVKAQFIHEHGRFFGHAKAFNKPFVRIATHIRWGAIPANVFELDLANVQHRKMLDHYRLS
jgi:hypothetical protein